MEGCREGKIRVSLQGCTLIFTFIQMVHGNNFASCMGPIFDLESA